MFGEETTLEEYYIPVTFLFDGRLISRPVDCKVPHLMQSLALLFVTLH